MLSIARLVALSWLVKTQEAAVLDGLRLAREMCAGGGRTLVRKRFDFFLFVNTMYV